MSKTIYKDNKGQFIIAETIIRYSVVLQDLSTEEGLTRKEKSPEEFARILKTSQAQKVSTI